MTTLDRINSHLAAIADLARQQQQTIDKLSNPVAPSPQPTHRHGVTLWLSDTPATFAPALRSAGIDVVRGWLDVARAEDCDDTARRRIAAWTDAAFDVIVCVAPKPGSPWSLAQLDELAARLCDTSAAYIELGNEPDLDGYWPAGNWRDFIARFAAPLASALRNRKCRAKLARPALGHIAKQLDYLPQFAAFARGIDADYQAVHPYGNSAGDIDRRLAAWQQRADKPLIATEWNIKTDAAGWRKNISAAIRAVKSRTVIDCYYRLRDRDPASTGGAGGVEDYSLCDAAGQPTAWGRIYREVCGLAIDPIEARTSTTN